jgi:hypothetical protein
MNLVEHLGRHFGDGDDQAQAWSFAESGYGIVTYPNQPFAGAITYLTTGLSRHILTQASGAQIAQELFISVRSEFAVCRPEVSLASLAEDFLERHTPIPNGQVIGWHKGVLEPRFSAVFCTSARCFPETFEQIEGDPPTVFVWLIPITGVEATYCRTHGHQAFDDLLLAENPDLLDLDRPELPIPCRNP